MGNLVPRKTEPELQIPALPELWREEKEGLFLGWGSCREEVVKDTHSVAG